MKDEKKYSDLVDALDQLEAWVCDIYAKADLCAPPDEDHVPPGPPIAAPSRPDQPASHVPPVPAAGDPLAKVKIPCFGDHAKPCFGNHAQRQSCHPLEHEMSVEWHGTTSFTESNRSSAASKLGSWR